MVGLESVSVGGSLGAHVLEGLLLARDWQHVLLGAEEPQADFLLLHDSARGVLPPGAPLAIGIELADLLEFELAGSQPLLDVVQGGPDLAGQGDVVLGLCDLGVVPQVRGPVEDRHHGGARRLLVPLLGRVKVRCSATEVLDWHVLLIKVRWELPLAWPDRPELLRARAKDPIVQAWRGQFAFLELLLPEGLTLHHSLVL